MRKFERIMAFDMKQMTRFLVVIIVVIWLFSACGSRKSDSQYDNTADADTIALAVDSLSLSSDAIDSVSIAADESFDDFFFNFAVNKRLQKSRIKFPLPEVKGEKTDLITEAKWKMDYFFMRQDFYTLLFDNEQEIEDVKTTDINHAIVEKIYFKTKSVKQYSFDRKNGNWILNRIEYIPIISSHNASFLQFYERFVTDSAFQSSSLNETVNFVGPDPDDDFSQMEGIITPDTWPAFAPVLPSKMIYNIVYGHPKKEGDNKVFVLRGIANGLEIELCFKRNKAGKWKLTKLTT